jgi:hypothetical protein
MAKLRLVDRDKTDLSAFQSEKQTVEALLKQKDNQIQLLTRKLGDSELKLNELIYKNEKLTFDLKQL